MLDIKCKHMFIYIVYIIYQGKNMITINLYYILLRDNLLYMYKIISIVYVTDVYIYIYIYIYTTNSIYTLL